MKSKIITKVSVKHDIVARGHENLKFLNKFILEYEIKLKSL